MQIIEYEEKYLEDVRDLLVELEQYIISIDYDHLDQLHPEYREKMAIKELEYAQKHQGKCYLALEKNKVIVLIICAIPPYDEYDYLDYKCPKRGRVTELIVTAKTRSKGVGQLLMKKLEDYFKAEGCQYILIDVFGYNDNAIKFYFKQGYHAKMLTTIKKI